MIIWVVIPAYNEENTICNVVKDVNLYIQNILVVNDCSDDKTKAALSSLPVQLIDNKHCLGYAKSLEKGIIEVFKKSADYAISFDADGQHKGSDIKKFISIIKSKEKPDFILGKRSYKNRFMEQIVSLYTKNRYKIADPFCGLKAIKNKIFNKYGYLENSYTIGTELILRAIKNGASFKEVNITVNKRLDDSRFGNFLKGNLMELKALFNIVKI